MADQIKTQDDDLVIKNEYANPNDASQYATSPNTTTDAANSKTGSGASAPEVNLGVDESGNPIKEQLKYSWESKAEDRADLSYQSDVLTAKSNMLENRQNLEAQGQQYQDQVAMDQYSKNQSAEKAGWTGGYVLDTERQMNYLKQTIQSQMYGQMELQKYGYNTSLAAARLAYDTNRFDLALEYYNTALSRAVSEAEITGYYVSPEASEMLDQYSMASRTMNDETASEEEKQRADKILAAVYEWFEANGISKNGVETYQHLVEERTHRLSVEQTLEYINQANKQIDSNTFSRVDANGNTIFSGDGSSVETINFNTIDQQELLNYISQNNTAKQQYYGYLDGKITQETQVQFNNWLIAKGLMNKSEDGKTYTPKDNVDYKSKLFEFISSSGIYDELKQQLESADPKTALALYTVFTEWDFEISLPDGTSFITTFNDLENERLNARLPSGYEKVENIDEDTYVIVGDSYKKYSELSEEDKEKYKDADKYKQTTTTIEEMLNKDDNNKPTFNFNYTDKTNVMIGGKGTTGKTVNLGDQGQVFFSDVKAVGGGDWDKESDFTLDSGIGDYYNLEIAEYYKTLAFDTQTTELLQNAYRSTHNNESIPHGTIIYYKGITAIYCNSHNITGFRKIKGQCGKGGGNDLTNALKSGSGIG